MDWGQEVTRAMLIVLDRRIAGFANEVRAEINTRCDTMVAQGDAHNAAEAAILLEDPFWSQFTRSTAADTS